MQIKMFRHEAQCMAHEYHDNDMCDCTPIEITPCNSCGKPSDEACEFWCDYNGTLSGLDDCR